MTQLAARTAVGVLAVLILTIAALVLFSSQLKGPLVRYIEAQSGRKLSVDGAFNARLLSWHPQFVAERVTLDNPHWSPPGVTAQVQRLVLTYNLSDLTLSGIVAEGATFHLFRDVVGGANWQFNEPGTGPSPGPPLIRSIDVRDARVMYEDRRRRLAFDGSVSLVDVPRPDGSEPPLRFEAKGQLNGHAAEVRIDAQPLLSAHLDQPYGFTFVETSTATRLTGRGTLPHPFDFRWLEATFDSVGGNLKDLYFLTGVNLLETGAYHLTGRMSRAQRHSEFNDLNVTSGLSDMQGRVVIDTQRRAPSHVEAQLHSKLLRIVDVGEQASERARAAEAESRSLVLPDRPFVLKGARDSDTHINLKADTLQAGKVPLKSVSAVIQIADGMVRVSPASATLRGGRINGMFRIDASQDVPAAELDVRLSNFIMGNFSRPAKSEDTDAPSPAPVDGAVHAHVHLQGRGDSFHAVASHASGTMTAVMPHGTVRASLAELAGFDLRGLGLMAANNKQETNIRCALASFDVSDGAATARTLLVDTEPVLIRGEGTIDLEKEVLDLQLHGQPKHPRLRVRAPLVVTGTFKHPAFSTEPLKPAAQAAGAVALGVLLTPVAAILAFVDPGLAKDADCGALLSSANGARQSRP